MKHLFTLLFIFSTLGLNGQWNIIEIGTSPTGLIDELVMLDGQNDGTNRIYAATWGGSAEEWSWDGTTWNRVDIITGIYVGFLQIAGGDGRDDGVNRVYVGEHGGLGRLFEVSWDGVSWNPVIVDSPGPITSIVIGDARDDGNNRLYVGGGWGTIEYEWTGSAWSINPISTNYSENGGSIGDGDNDGSNEWYVNSNCEKVYTWTGSSFLESYLLVSCATGVWTDANWIGEGRNDGNNNVYVNGEVLGKKEYTWTGTAWSEVDLGSTYNQRGDVMVAALHADGNYRVYGTASYESWGGTQPPGPLEEYEWSGSAWVNNGAILGGTSGASGYLEHGVGRNDDTVRMYIANMNTQGIYEITASNPNYVGPPPGAINENSHPIVKIEIYPNPAHDIAIVDIQDATETTADIIITNTVGAEIKSLNAVNTDVKITVDLKEIPAGVYFVKVSAGDQQQVKRLLVEK